MSLSSQLDSAQHPSQGSLPLGLQLGPGSPVCVTAHFLSRVGGVLPVCHPQKRGLGHHLFLQRYHPLGNGGATARPRAPACPPRIEPGFWALTDSHCCTPCLALGPKLSEHVSVRNHTRWWIPIGRDAGWVGTQPHARRSHPRSSVWPPPSGQLRPRSSHS